MLFLSCDIMIKMHHFLLLTLGVTVDLTHVKDHVIFFPLMGNVFNDWLKEALAS